MDASTSAVVLAAGSYLGYLLFCAPFLAGTFAAHDGLVSISRGFRVPELRAHIRAAALQSRLAVGRAFPGRVYAYRTGL